MDLQFLCDYAEPIVVGICLCVGYVIKVSLSFIPNKYIPLIMAVLGTVTNILHQVFKNLLKEKDETEG